ncbi:MAG: hypothetical protein ACTHQE_14820 [Thermomicrobiales bacterium]|jgi:predicted ArsR family transcriptional regulator
MSRSKTGRRGRPPRHYQIRVRTERRDPIDYAALAQAALEQAAMDQRRVDEITTATSRYRLDNDTSDRVDLPDHGDEGGRS